MKGKERNEKKKDQEENEIVRARSVKGAPLSLWTATFAFAFAQHQMTTVTLSAKTRK